MKSIEDHIEKDKQILDDPQANPAARRHAKEELHDLEEYAEHHKDEIKAGDHHDLMLWKYSVIYTQMNQNV